MEGMESRRGGGQWEVRRGRGWGGFISRIGGEGWEGESGAADGWIDRGI
jgi:hypothetical protein